ncbi:hypothetical protein [Paractinoplanes toevensis]|uniref:Uncharacterized protein n=1 Tax=Paractinoplanes toevensis TaxID=571911 RepID=A0A919TD11_9ACTN|nr:hypothetical protein [Actinoplanes toevensis]GIM93067.1 hypothetical protein Ato02nite_048600 [Actinoplanes toevensis]
MSERPGPRRPRTTAKRVLVAGLIDVAAGGVAFLIEDLAGATDLLFPSLYVVLAPFVAWLAPKVSYRRRDALITPWVLPIVA